MPELTDDPKWKPTLRREMRDQLRTLPHDEVQARSRHIVNRLMLDGDWWQPGGVVAMFGGLPGEPDLFPLMPWLHERGVQTAFFAVSDRALLPCAVDSIDDLRRGVLNVWEPAPPAGRLVALRDLTTILTPGLAFGQSDGSRLGRGAGYYDRLFGHPEVRALRIGIAFDLQIVPVIPTEAHDARVHMIVTESGWIRF